MILVVAKQFRSRPLLRQYNEYRFTYFFDFYCNTEGDGKTLMSAAKLVKRLLASAHFATLCRKEEFGRLSNLFGAIQGGIAFFGWMKKTLDDLKKAIMVAAIPYFTSVSDSYVVCHTWCGRSCVVKGLHV